MVVEKQIRIETRTVVSFQIFAALSQSLLRLLLLLLLRLLLLLLLLRGRAATVAHPKIQRPQTGVRDSATQLSEHIPLCHIHT